jgi:hypothetical protein
LYPHRQAKINPRIKGRIPTERKGIRESLHQAIKYRFSFIDPSIEIAQQAIRECMKYPISKHPYPNHTQFPNSNNENIV